MRSPMCTSFYFFFQKVIVIFRFSFRSLSLSWIPRFSFFFFYKKKSHRTSTRRTWCGERYLFRHPVLVSFQRHWRENGNDKLIMQPWRKEYGPPAFVRCLASSGDRRTQRLFPSQSRHQCRAKVLRRVRAVFKHQDSGVRITDLSIVGCRRLQLRPLPPTTSQ